MYFNVAFSTDMLGRGSRSSFGAIYIYIYWRLFVLLSQIRLSLSHVCILVVSILLYEPKPPFYRLSSMVNSLRPLPSLFTRTYPLNPLYHPLEAQGRLSL